MPAGDRLSEADRHRLQRAVRNAEATSGLSFSVYVGIAEENPRAYAERLHAALANPAGSVMIMCDPEFRALEIVTGVDAARRLDDRACALAAASMQTSFAGGDIIGGLTHGVQQLGQAARVPRTLHLRR